jgi:hypothetical protein
LSRLPVPLRACSWGMFLSHQQSRGARRDRLTPQQLPLELECYSAWIPCHQGYAEASPERNSPQLCSLYYAAAVERSGLKPEDVQEVFVGNVLSAKYDSLLRTFEFALMSATALARTLPASAQSVLVFPNRLLLPPSTRSARPPSRRSLLAHKPS